MKRRLAVVFACALLVSALVRPAMATHEPIQTLEGTSYGGADTVFLGLDSGSTATAVWNEQGGAYYSTRPVGGSFSAPKVLTPNYVSTIAFDESPNGNAVVALGGSFNEGHLLAYVRQSRTGSFGPLQVLADTGTPTAFDIDVAISDAGRAVVTWNSFENGDVIRAALSDNAGDFAAATVVDPGPGATNPRVDMDATGAAAIVYDLTSSANDEIRVASAPAGGAFGAPTTVETLEQGPGSPDIAVNSTGAAVIAHADFASPTDACCSRDKVEARYGNVNGTFGAFQNLTDTSIPTAASEAEVAIDDSGRAAVLFNATPDGVYGMYASVSDATGTFPVGQPQAVSPHQLVGGPGVARRSYEIAAGGGEFTAFWINDHDEDGLNEAWQSSTSGSVFGAAHELSIDAAGDEPDKAHGDRDDSGQTVAGWSRFVQGDNIRVQVTPATEGGGSTGTDGDDDLDGTSGDDIIHLLGGDDTYNASGGNDSVYGETGNDKLAGGAGTDLLDGGANNDSLTGGDGGDTLKGGGGNDVLTGDGANQIARVAEYEGAYSASAGGVDVLLGGGGRDKLVGGAGLDRLNGGPGSDLCIVDSRKEKRRAQSCETIRLRRGHL